jgi:hypothetical protein
MIQCPYRDELAFCISALVLRCHTPNSDKMHPDVLPAECFLEAFLLLFIANCVYLVRALKLELFDNPTVLKEKLTKEFEQCCLDVSGQSIMLRHDVRTSYQMHHLPGVSLQI